MTRFSAGLASVLLLAGHVAANAQSVTFDGYVLGIKTAELTISGNRYSIRKRDNATGKWSSAHSASESAVAGDTAFALGPGAIRNLPARIKELRAIKWSPVKAVGWPDANTIYVPHRELTATVNGKPVKAVHWAVRDATRPLDLVIGPDDQLIAGFDNSNDLVLVRRGYEGLTTVGRWNDPKISPGKYGYRALEKQMMPTPDGPKLATLVYLPDGDVKGPFPTVFIRTPYGITSLINGFWHYPARGYAVVFQAARGTSFTDPPGRSEGIWQPVINERRDGATALEWIVKQPWSNGKICMQGGSYVGYTQWAAAMSKNPALKCLVPESSMGTTFSDQPYMGGTFVEGMAYYMFYMLDQKILPNRTWTEVLHHRPLIDIDEFATGKDLPQWNTMVEHSTNDSYWKEQDWYRSTEPRQFSTLQISGWWDDDFPGTESNWALMQRYGGIL